MEIFKKEIYEEITLISVSFFIKNYIIVQKKIENEEKYRITFFKGKKFSLRTDVGKISHLLGHKFAKFIEIEFTTKNELYDCPTVNCGQLNTQ